MPKGIIKFFNEHRGYGFIEFDEISADQAKEAQNNVFVHYSQINDNGYRTLKEGEEVTFDIKKSNHGLEAVNVQKVP